MKLLCLYQVMFQYRVGTYEAIANLPNVDFELWHGKDKPNSKSKNFKGDVGFCHKQLPSFWISGKSNNGEVNLLYHPLLFFRLIISNPDVILTEGASNILTATIVFLYCKLFRKKMIWWSLGALAGRSYKGVNSVVHKWVRYIERHSDAIFAYSSQAESYFRLIGVKHDRIFKAVNVFDTRKKIAEVKANEVIAKEHGFNVVFIGTITPQKQLEMLVIAINELSKQHNDISLHIIGNGPYLNMIKDFIKQREITAHIVFHGRIIDGLNSMIQRYTLLVLPGLGGLAIVDGMISSLPIISGKADGTELDLITNGENGFVTKAMTKEFLIDKINYFYTNPNELKRMGQKSFEQITGHFSFENYIRIFVSCLKSVGYEE